MQESNFIAIADPRGSSAIRLSSGHFFTSANHFSVILSGNGLIKRLATRQKPDV
jgi:hypothetical protein